MRRCSRRFKRLAAGIGIASGELDDVAQDALVRVWENRDSIDPDGNVSAWLDSVARNQAREHGRRTSARGEVLTSREDRELEDPQANPEEIAIARDKSMVLEGLLSAIPAARRIVYIECELVGKTVPEVATALGIPLETAKKRLRLAWGDIARAKAQWQARQRGRGWDPVPLLLPPIQMQWARLRRLCIRMPLHVPAAAAAIGLLVLPITWSPLRPALAAPMLAGVVRSAPVPVLASEPVDVEAAGEVAAVREAEPAAGASTAAPTPSPERSAPRLEEERRLIERSRVALRTGGIAGKVQARRLLEQHARGFPNGQLAGEREALLEQLR